VAKSAVTRNLIRRRVTSALRTRIKEMPDGLYLFVAKSGAQSLKGKILETELDTLLKNI
jgi:ribonuclease P protein component